LNNGTDLALGVPAWWRDRDHLHDRAMTGRSR